VRSYVTCHKNNGTNGFAEIYVQHTKYSIERTKTVRR